MSWTTTINGVSYTAPDVGENFWGTQVKSWMQAVGGTSSSQGGMLKKDGGLFQLLSEVNFGTAFGIKSLTYTSGSAASGSAAASGVLRLKRADIIGWRNNADSGNLSLGVSTSNWIQWQSVDLADISSAQTFTNKTISGLNNTITNIALSSIVAPGAGVVISDGATISSEARLNLSRMAVGTQYYVLMGNGASSPSYQTITNNSIDAAAAIARSKLASGSASHVVINDGSGVMSSEAILNVSRGGTGLSAIGTSNQILGVNNAASTNEYKSLATGTSGTDFTIIHSAGAVTFNLPDASAVNRGALTSADWSTFNSKISGSGTNGQVALFDGSGTITSSASVVYSTSANSNTLSLLSGIRIGQNTTIAPTAGTGSIRYNSGVLEYSDGVNWNTLGVTGAGILTLNTLSATAQTLVTGTAGTDFAISSASSTHTFNLPDAGASARGVVTTGTQTIAGVKTFSSNAVFSSYITNGSQIFRDASDGSLSISAGQSGWNPNLDIQTGHTYTNDGELIVADTLLGAGTLEGAGSTLSFVENSIKWSGSNSFKNGSATINVPTDSASLASLNLTETFTGTKFFTTGLYGYGANTSGLFTTARLKINGSGTNDYISWEGLSSNSHILVFKNTTMTGYNYLDNAASTFKVGTSTAHDVDIVTNGSSRLKATSAGDISVISGNLVIGTSGKGIDFSADSSAAGMTSELLSDYEQGAWTPGIAFGGGSTGVTYGASNGGVYTKIGSHVFVCAFLQITNKGSSTGNGTITGLPFAIRNTASAYASVNIGYFTNMAGLTSVVCGYGIVNSSTIGLQTGSATDSSNISQTAFTNGSTMMISFNYVV